MQLAFCLYKYFPFGGLQRDFLRIALACQARGHAIRVYTLDWQGDIPQGFEVVHVPARGYSSPRRYRKFSVWVEDDLVVRPVDRIVGFNKMPGLDVYYAADPCFEDKARTQRSPLYRMGARYRHFAAYEHAVFSPESHTEILMISRAQQPLFVKYYGTPEARFHMLPPGIAPDRRAPPDAGARRMAARAKFGGEFGLRPDDLLLVQIGSGFARKGVDRAIKALAALPDELRQRARLVSIGDGNAEPYLKRARKLGVGERVFVPGGRADVPDFLLAADVLLHPARHENTGTVLLEALVAGVPTIATDICGYAPYLVDADAGKVVGSPFAQKELDATLAALLADDAERARLRRNALAFAARADLYSLPEKAADFIVGKAQPKEGA